ncbi:23S rRNA (guanosine(2251)-2'-O)-methyltransferase RlmB [Clostridiaceae bacterium 35-E11]
MIFNIHSHDNPVVKRVKQLHKKKYRTIYKQYLVEGVRIIEDALTNHKEIRAVIFCDELYKTAGGESLLQKLEKKKIDVYCVPDKMFMELCDTQNPQGIIAVLPCEVYDLAHIIDKSNGFFIVLDRIQDPGNLGTIIRTADAAGVDAVLMGKGCVDLYNAKTIRSTMGSIFHIPILALGTTEEIVRILKEKNVKIITTDLETKEYYYEIDYTDKMALVVGNEANGVLPEVLVDSDHIIKIPMIGKAESLNASIAASIVMYEAVKQRIKIRKF